MEKSTLILQLIIYIDRYDGTSNNAYFSELAQTPRHFPLYSIWSRPYMTLRSSTNRMSAGHFGTTLSVFFVNVIRSLGSPCKYKTSMHTWKYLGGGRGPPPWPTNKQFTHKNATCRCRSTIPQCRHIYNSTGCK